jgi:hypothetical protein
MSDSGLIRCLAMIGRMSEMDNKEKRALIEDELRNAYAARHYPAAHAAFDEWWKLGSMDQVDTAFLNILGDLCHRQGDVVRGDLVDEFLAEHGTDAQCVRALRMLNRRWFGTPKQVRLSDIYRHVLAKYPDLSDNQEILEMGRKLSGFS